MKTFQDYLEWRFGNNPPLKQEIQSHLISELDMPPDLAEIESAQFLASRKLRAVDADVAYSASMEHGIQGIISVMLGDSPQPRRSKMVTGRLNIVDLRGKFPSSTISKSYSQKKIYNVT